MKQILLLAFLLVFSISYAQKPLNAPNGVKSGSTTLTPTEISYLDGATSNVQIQINGTVRKDSLVDPDPIIYSAMSVIPTTYVTDNYTLILPDAGKIISMTASTVKTITIPLFNTVAFPLNTLVYFENLGTADLTIAITATGTLTSESSYVNIPAKGTAFIRKNATNTWNLAGRLK